MASSDSNRNNGDQLEDEEEEEEEYEEIEEVVEVEEEEEEFEEVEEEEEFEEVEEEEEVEEFEEEEEFEDEEEFEEVEEEVEEGKQEVGEEEEEVKEEIQEFEGDEEEYEEVEEEEFEEVEEEEFEEVEEEVTDEEDRTIAEAEFDDKGAAEINDAANSDFSVPLVVDNMCKVARQDVEFEGNEVCLRSGESRETSAVKFEANIVHNAHTAEVFCLNEGSSLPEQSNNDGKVISSIDVGSSKSLKLLEHITGPLDIGSDSVEDKQGHVEQTMMASASKKHASAPESASNQLGKLDTIDVEESKLLSEEANLHFPSRRSIDQKESRVRPRSSSPGAECQDGNKRAAIICEFFAKGWCIKGSSCRFLHKREHVDNATQLGDRLPAERELRPDKGSGDDADASGSTAGKDILMEHGEGIKLPKYEDKDKIALLERKISSSFVSADSQKPSSHKDGSRTISNPREAEAEVFKEYHLFYNHDSSVSEGRSMLSQNFFPRSGSSTRESEVASGSDSILRVVEESAAMRRRYSLDFHSSLPSYHFSSWKSTLLHKSSLSSGSDPATFSGTSYAQDQLISFKYQAGFTPYNWEPSVPFRSSYFIQPVKRSDIQYDPFRDSIEQPNVEHASLKNYSYDNTQDVQSISGRNSLELHKGLWSDIWDKNYIVRDKVIPEVVAESAATSASDAQNKKIIEEENPTVPGSVKDILKASRSINDVNSKLKGDLLRNGEMKVNVRQPNELDDEESKAIKYFRAALIEYVKELMKPIWHEGRLSKDVYKVIVQKAEDKILSTLQSDQVPSSSESIKQYLSSSRPKILKLIQAYVDKYGKF